MYVRNTTFKNALIISLLFHGIALFVLDRNLELSFIDVVDSMPVISISFVPAEIEPAAKVQAFESPEEIRAEETVLREAEPVLPEEKAVAAVEPVVPAEESALEGDEPVEPAEASERPVSSEPTKQSPAESAAFQPGPAVSREPSFTGQELDSLDFSGSARMPAPAYPSRAKRMEWEGNVTVSFVINKRGKVESLTLEESSGYELLDKAVLNTVKKGWRFPRRDEPVRVWKTFSFRLI